MLALDVIKTELREGQYSWPGGYPKVFFMRDGEALSYQAAHENFREICRAHLAKDRCSDWAIAAYDVHWEGEPLICVHSGRKIESAYGPVDGE